jgi:hypothetical protein
MRTFFVADGEYYHLIRYLKNPNLNIKTKSISYPKNNIIVFNSPIKNNEHL